MIAESCWVRLGTGSSLVVLLKCVRFGVGSWEDQGLCKLCIEKEPRRARLQSNPLLIRLSRKFGLEYARLQHLGNRVEWRNGMDAKDLELMRGFEVVLLPIG